MNENDHGRRIAALERQIADLQARDRDRDTADRDWRESRRLIVWRLDDKDKDIEALHKKHEETKAEHARRLESTERKFARLEARIAAFGAIGGAALSAFWEWARHYIVVGKQ